MLAAARPAVALPTPVTAVDAAQIIEAIRQHQPVQLADIRVTGPLDLRGIDSVAGPLICRRCVLDQVTMANVTFARAVDLVGSVITGSLDAAGSVFNGAVAMSDTTIQGGADLSGTAFADVADFSGATFAGSVRFDDARFRGDARFENLDAQGPARFVATMFAGRASFSGVRAVGRPARQPHSQSGCSPSIAQGGGFEQGADFRQAAFAAEVDLRQLCLAGPATFDQAIFNGPVSAAQAQFSNDASFSNCRLTAGASFIDTHFGGVTSFSRASAGGRMDFEAASFDGIPVFSHFESTGVVSFKDARFHTKVIFDKVEVKQLDLAFGDVFRLGAAQSHALTLIESGARGRSDIALANQARYDRLALEGDQRPLLHRVADWTFYRVVAGYLVRPLRPLSWLLGALLVAAGIRTIGSRRQNPRPGATLRRYLLQVERTVGVAVSKKASRQEDQDDAMATVAQWLEWGLYKALIVAFVIGVANSNETLRQMLDAIK